ncbi:uncharacterized protein (TIGR02611 family) [Murinocardiopsis flavida]|uniref:Uncharacterized protein (TIGR02611 family) n=1 Tax=Murinocardiopsis flavida TaxID=645275 RepID=A0A2P8DKD9_9ACTN|nr:PGPGW domain-containing protein [Murinocardiopsis flavida]PSK97682.1 uncharacterized protein (TIGR02611 family) [Murinocardiopsis flavida]
MHSHPVLHWTWRSVIIVVGGFILLAGIVMCVTPGPGALGILLGLAILATEFSWAHNLLHRARVWERKAREKAIATQRRRRARKAAFRTDRPHQGS